MEKQLLLQKLETTQKVIQGMLSLKIPDDLLEQRISFLVQLISEIPPEETELNLLWNNQLVDIWTIQSKNRASRSKPIDAASVDHQVNQGTLSANKQLVSPPIHREVFSLQRISTGGDEISSQNLANCLISFSELSCSAQEEPPQVDPTFEEELTQLEQAIESTFANEPPSRSKLEWQIAEFMSLVGCIPGKFKGQIKKWAAKSDFIVERCLSLPMQSPTTGNVAFSEEESTKLKQQAFAVEKLLRIRPLQKETIERILVEMVNIVAALPENQIKDTCHEITVQLMSSYQQLEQEDAELKEATSAPGVHEGVSSQDKSARCTSPLTIEAPKCSKYTIKGIWETLSAAFKRAEHSLTLTLTRFTKLDYINDLILLAGKSRFLIDQAEADEPSRQNLSAEVYTWVVGQFSDELYAAYIGQKCSKAIPLDLNLVIDFLYEQLRSIYVEQNSRRVEVPRADQELVDMVEVPPPKKKDHYLTELVGCEYCHSTEHMKGKCGLRDSILCLKCFSYGHYKETCTKSPLTKDNFII